MLRLIFLNDFLTGHEFTVVEFLIAYTIQLKFSVDYFLSRFYPIFLYNQSKKAFCKHEVSRCKLISEFNIRFEFIRNCN